MLPPSQMVFLDALASLELVLSLTPSFLNSLTPLLFFENSIYEISNLSINLKIYKKTKRQIDKKTKRQIDKKTKRQHEKKTKWQMYEKRKRQKRKTKKRSWYCDVRAVSHFCDVLSSFHFTSWRDKVLKAQSLKSTKSWDLNGPLNFCTLYT